VGLSWRTGCADLARVEAVEITLDSGFLTCLVALGRDSTRFRNDKDSLGDADGQ
jgi:hypothetical protein